MKRVHSMYLKVSWFRKQILLFSFEPKTQRNYFLISALASKKSPNQKTLLYNYVKKPVISDIKCLYFFDLTFSWGSNVATAKYTNNFVFLGKNIAGFQKLTWRPRDFGHLILTYSLNFFLETENLKFNDYIFWKKNNFPESYGT